MPGDAGGDVSGDGAGDIPVIILVASQARAYDPEPAGLGAQGMAMSEHELAGDTVEARRARFRAARAQIEAQTRQRSVAEVVDECLDMIDDMRLAHRRWDIVLETLKAAQLFGARTPNVGTLRKRFWACAAERRLAESGGRKPEQQPTGKGRVKRQATAADVSAESATKSVEFSGSVETAGASLASPAREDLAAVVPSRATEAPPAAPIAAPGMGPAPALREAPRSARPATGQTATGQTDDAAAADHPAQDRVVHDVFAGGPDLSGSVIDIRAPGSEPVVIKGSGRVDPAARNALRSLGRGAGARTGGGHATG